MQIDKYIQISKLNPNLNYNIKIANEFSKMNCSSEIIIKRYFENQSKEYVEDIKSLDLINSIPISNLTNAYIVILCYNEQESISKIIDLYSKQKGIPNDSFEICFVVNMPQKSQKEYENDYTNFKKSIQIVLDKRKIFSKIHIVCKQFNNNDYGIGRARKYGFDYCLYRISLLNNKNIENTFIISNEGDMVDIPSFYLKKYFDFFNVNKNVLVQGEIDFPDFVRNNKILYHFVETRSRIQLHQGIDSLNFLHFGGIMPIGRNFAVHPRIYAQVNGIEITRKTGTLTPASDSIKKRS